MESDSAAAAEAARNQADRRFAERLAESGAPDPRDRYRDWLRELRSRDENAFRKALEYYEEQLVPAVADADSDPLVEWTEYGVRLAQRLRPGAAVQIDVTGRSRPYDRSAAVDELVLHLPKATREQAFAVRLPPQLSPAQHAAFELLVRHGVGG